MTTTNWDALLAKITKAQKNVDEWREGLAEAEQTLGNARAEMAAALGLSSSDAQAAAPPAKKVKKLRHDYQRRARVLELLKEKGGFLTTDDVTRAERCGSGCATSILSRLCAEGRLTRISKGRYSTATTLTVVAKEGVAK